MLSAVLLLSRAVAGRWLWLRRTFGLGLGAVALLQFVGAASGGYDPLQPLAHLGQRGGSAQAPVAFQMVRNVAELDAAVANAGRPVMLDFYADWCVSCKEMERFTFTDLQVQQHLSRFLLLKVDVTQNNTDDRELLRRFRLFGPPGTIFFDAQGRELANLRVVGFQNARPLTAALLKRGKALDSGAPAVVKPGPTLTHGAVVVVRLRVAPTKTSVCGMASELSSVRSPERFTSSLSVGVQRAETRTAV